MLLTKKCSQSVANCPENILVAPTSYVFDKKKRHVIFTLILQFVGFFVFNFNILHNIPLIRGIQIVMFNV